jgi:hypothetical protein
MTLQEANLSIPRLSRQAVAGFGGPEDLDRPLDGDIRVTENLPNRKVSLVVGGQEVSWAVLVDYRQQIGDGVVRMAGLGGVGTHDEHRFRGYARRVLDNWLRVARREGYDVAMLYGISGFYPKFGFAETFPGIVHRLAVRDAERGAGGGLRFADYRREHLPAVLKMYHRNNAGRTGPTLRGAKWRAFPRGLAWNAPAVVRVGLDRRGRPMAYLVHDATDPTAVLELGCAGPAQFGDLLREAAAVAWGLRAGQIQFHLPPDHDFIRFCLCLGLQQEATYRRDGGAMVRLIHVKHALEKIAPVLARRARGRGRLLLRTNLGAALLEWSPRRMKVSSPAGRAAGPREQVRLPQWALAQMMYGYLDVRTLAARGAVQGSPRALAAMEGLFPMGHHYHYFSDKF